MLLKLVLMRAGPNNYENYLSFIEVIGDDYSYEGLTANLRNYKAGWLRSYRRPLMTAQDRPHTIVKYVEGLEKCWVTMTSCPSVFPGWHADLPTSINTYKSVLEMLGGHAKFTAYQICLDIGYKHPELYNEDLHVFVGPGCEIPEHKIDEVKEIVQAKVTMKVTKQTSEGLGCVYGK
eukprot:COSAG01_NODE_26663_length_707_cov_0.363487_1_plen_176_part_10